MQPLEVLARIRPLHWIVASAAILLFEYLTGPFIQLSILFILPVALATATHGRLFGAMVALALPLLRLSFFLRWDLASSWQLKLADTAVDMAVLMAFALLIDQIIRQQRAIRVLEGMLPICSFCKRIRDEGGRWQQLESYIGQRSRARFSHTFCPECGRKHYPASVD
jgi:hypothetical protein